MNFASIPCPECRRWWKAYGRDLDTDTQPVSRADAEHVHRSHRPMHPSQVGHNHIRAARKAWADWEALSPGRRLAASPSLPTDRLGGGGDDGSRPPIGQP